MVNRLTSVSFLAAMLALTFNGTQAAIEEREAYVETEADLADPDATLNKYDYYA
jgi:hypothetical protein